ncbi:MAG: sigma 54-interacting transcriptional regulator [Magnetococcales bacterium]|nr:sigma 54-interacting transcriptional regulator [Magnetococcales bacterium]
MDNSILIIDDDPIFLDSLSFFLSMANYSPTIARSVQDGLETLQQKIFDLVILDICLPDGSGLQVLSAIQKHHPQTLSIILTGYPEVDTVCAALREGAFDFLIKPVMPPHLEHVVALAMEHKRIRENQEMMRNRLEAVFRSVDDAIVALDENWRIIQGNDTAFQLLGLSPCSGKSLPEQAPWLFAEVEPLLMQARAESNGNRAMSVLTLNEEGVRKILSCTASLFHDPVQNSPGVILVVRDESRLALLDVGTHSRQGWNGLVGSSRPMQEVYELIERLADVDSTVLITGETGTGKELVARALHNTSSRRHHPFVAVNCAALPSGLLESELFGHTRGAFTNAVRHKIGRFKLADGGTIFLDEIGDLSLEMQVKLLRVLQEQVFEPLGDNNPVRIDVRVITATHRHLREAVREGHFREDLYYRLKVVEMRLPPLRDHKTDLPQLIDHFLTKFNARLKRSIKGVSEEVLAAFMEYSWPGNVRELEHILEHAMVLAQQSILVWSNLPSEFRADVQSAQPPRIPANAASEPSVKDGCLAEKRPDREAILQALALSRWQVQLTAQRLGISRSTLWRRMKEMGLHQPDEN